MVFHTQSALKISKTKTATLTNTQKNIYNLIENLKERNTNKIKRNKRKFTQIKRKLAQGWPKADDLNCRPASKAGGLEVNLADLYSRPA